MGATQSQFDDIDNDYELVIRVSKALDRELTKEFHIDGDRLSLMEKIDMLKENYPALSSSTSISSMKKLVVWRNKLVHEFHINDLSDLGVKRDQFRRMYSDVKKELERLKPRRGSSHSTGAGSRQIATTSTPSSDHEDSGVGKALMMGGALLAMALMASSGQSACQRCGRGVDGNRNYCTSCSWSGGR